MTKMNIKGECKLLVEGDYTSESWRELQIAFKKNTGDDDMKKTKRVLSLVLVVSMVLSLFTTALAGAVIDEIPLKVWEKVEDVGAGKSTVILTDSMGRFDVIVGTSECNYQIVRTNDAVITTDYILDVSSGSSIERHTTTSSGITWDGVFENEDDLSSVRLSDNDMEIIYVSIGSTANILEANGYDADYLNENNLPIEGAADLTVYNSTKNLVIDIDYTDKSWQIYNVVVEDNIVTVNNTQEEVDIATANIGEAQLNLVIESADLDHFYFWVDMVEIYHVNDIEWEKYRNFIDSLEISESSLNSEIEEALIQVRNYEKVELTPWNSYLRVLTLVNESDYTLVSWYDYGNKLIDIGEATESDSNDRLRTVARYIRDAQLDLLVLKELNMVEYNKLSLLDSEYYTEHSWGIYEQVLMDNILTEPNSQAEIDEATLILYAASKFLIPQCELDDYYDLVHWPNPKLYTSGSIRNYELNIVPIDESNTFEELTNAKDRMLNSKDNMTKLVGIEFYYELLDFFDTIEHQFTEDSWIEFENDIESYGINEDSEVDEISDGVLELILWNAGALDTKPEYGIYSIYKIFMAYTMHFEDNYTEQSWEEFEDIIDKQGLNSESTESEMYQAINEIRQAEATVLKVIPDLSEYIELSGKNESDYTKPSWADYAEVLENNQLTENSRPFIVWESTGIIKEAYESILVLQSDLDKYYDTLDLVREELYTESSWSSYTEIIKDFVADEYSSTERIIEAIGQIRDEQQSLRMLYDFEIYQKMLDLLVESEYTPESWANFQLAIQSHLATEDSTNEEISILIQNISYEIFKLKLKEGVKSLYAYNTMLEAGNHFRYLYTDKSWDLYQEEIAKYVVTLDNTMDEIEDALPLIFDARIDFLELKPDLTEYLETLDLFNEEVCTKASWSEYVSVLEENEVTVSNKAREVRAAVANIVEAQENLVKIADLTAYNGTLALVIQSDYTTISWDIYKEVVIENIVTEQNTKEQVNLAVNNIITAQENLIKIADLIVYNETLSSVTQSNYTEASWGVYQAVVLENIVNEQNTQEEVDLAVDNIITAKEKLVKIRANNGGGGSGGGSIDLPIEPVTPPVTPPVDDVIITVGEHKVVVKKDIVIKEKINGYIKGYSDKTFKPNNSITRAETSQMLSNMLVNSGMLKSEVTDIGGEWYSGAIEKVTSLGVMNGYEDNSFKPNKNITRQEFAITLVNLMDLSKIDIVGNKEFPDIENVYGKEAIELLASLGVISGYPDGTFGPDREITRAEVVVIINRLLGGSLEGGLEIDAEFTDIEDSWAAEEIMRALGK